MAALYASLAEVMPSPVVELNRAVAVATVWHGHPVWSVGSDPGRSPVCLLKAY